MLDTEWMIEGLNLTPEQAERYRKATKAMEAESAEYNELLRESTRITGEDLKTWIGPVSDT